MLSQGHGSLVQAVGTKRPRDLGNEVLRRLLVCLSPGHLEGCTDVRSLIWAAAWLSALTAEGQTLTGAAWATDVNSNRLHGA